MITKADSLIIWKVFHIVNKVKKISKYSIEGKEIVFHFSDDIMLYENEIIEQTLKGFTLCHPVIEPKIHSFDTMKKLMVFKRK